MAPFAQLVLEARKLMQTKDGKLRPSLETPRFYKEHYEVINEEIIRAFDLLGTDIEGLERPEVYIDRECNNGTGAYFMIGNNVIGIHPCFVDYYNSEITRYNMESFRTTFRHELAHWAVRGMHLHDNFRFRYYLELFGGSDYVGGCAVQTKVHQHVLRLCGADLYESLINQKLVIAPKATWFGRFIHYMQQKRKGTLIMMLSFIALNFVNLLVHSLIWPFAVVLLQTCYTLATSMYNASLIYKPMEAQTSIKIPLWKPRK